MFFNRMLQRGKLDSEDHVPDGADLKVTDVQRYFFRSECVRSVLLNITEVIQPQGVGGGEGSRFPGR